MAQVDRQFYPVQSIIDKTIMEGKVYYLVKWKGFDQAQATWESARSLKYVKPLVKQYNLQQKQRKNHRKDSKDTGETSILSNVSEVNSQRTKANQRGNTSVSKIFTNQSKNKEKTNKIIHNEERSRNKVSKENTQLSKQKPRSQNDEQFSFQQKKKPSFAGSIGTRAACEKKEQNRIIFKPICIKRIKYSQITSLIPQRNQFSNSSKIQIQPNQGVNKSNSLNTTVKEKVGLSIDQEQTKSKSIKNDSKCLKRLSLLHRSDSNCAFEYFIEEQNGKLSIISGQQLIKIYPHDFVSYFQKIVLKKLS